MKRVLLKDLCLPNQIGKYGIPASAEKYSIDKIRYLRISDIDDYGNLKNDDLKSVSSKDIDKYLLKEGDLVVARTGNSTGRTYYHENKNGKLAFAGFLIKYGLDPSKLNPKYLKYYTISGEYKKWVENLSVGSTRGNINAHTFEDCPICLPSRKQQDDLVSILSALDSKIEINNRINAELEAMVKTLYDYWFVQFDFPDKDGKPYKTNGGKMMWNEELKREIPDGWKVKNLFGEMDIQYGFPFSTNKFTDEVTDKPVIRIRDILENTISTYTTENVDVKYRLIRNDLLIGMDGNFHLNFWDKDGAYLNQRSVRLRSKKDSNVSNFQAYFELSPYIKAREKNVSRTTVGHLSDKDLKRLFVISSKKTNKFNPKETFDSILEKIITNRLENQKLSESRDWLLPMLINGQVR